MAATGINRKWSMVIFEGLLLMLQTTFVNGGSNACQDIDHDACVNMAKQSPNMCSDPNLGTVICPAFCNNCPLMCYSCASTTYDIRNCNTVSCGSGENCLVKHFVNSTTTMFKMSCDTAQICSFKKRTIGAQCCSTDLCNIPVPPTTTPTSTTFVVTATTPSGTRTIPTTTRTIPMTTPGMLTTVPPFDQRSRISQSNLNLMHSVNASCRSDVLLLIDESCGYDIFTRVVKQILRDVTNQSDVGQNKVRFAMESFNTKSRSRWGLDSHIDKSELLRVLDELSIQGDGDTDNYVAIDHLLKSRPLMDVVLMFSCSRRGSSQTKTGNFENELNQLRAQYRSVILIGLDGADMEDLAMYTSDEFHLFSIPSAFLYTHDYIVEWILHEICPNTV
ncbi:collagen [Mactra antiquata]